MTQHPPSLTLLPIIPPPQDADDEFWAATSPDLAAVSGKYFVNKKARQSPPASYEEEAQRRLWAVLEQQTGVTYSRPHWHSSSERASATRN